MHPFAFPYPDCNGDWLVSFAALTMSSGKEAVFFLVFHIRLQHMRACFHFMNTSVMLNVTGKQDTMVKTLTPFMSRA